MPAPVSSFSLSSIYRALGMRDPRIMPTIAAGEITPVIVLGDIETFAPEVVEGRGVINVGRFNVGVGEWRATSMQANAPGGVIIEHLAYPIHATMHMAPQRPFTGALLTPFSIGGQVLASLFEDSGLNLLPAPSGIALGGTQTTAGEWVSGTDGLIDRVWVPPGWFFWMIYGVDQNIAAAWRFRELAEQQGPT